MTAHAASCAGSTKVYNHTAEGDVDQKDWALGFYSETRKKVLGHARRMVPSNTADLRSGVLTLVHATPNPQADTNANTNHGTNDNKCDQKLNQQSLPLWQVGHAVASPRLWLGWTA
jgi:hypothetical protein